MATKKSVKKSVKKTSSPTKLPFKPNIKFLTSFILVVLVGAILFYGARRYRGFILAGMVNKTPITRWELNKVLSRRYGQAVMEELINNKLLSQAAQDKGITISSEDIAQELLKLEESLGGKENLELARVQYGLSQEDLNDQVRLRLLQERLAAQLFPTEISDEEVSEYYSANESLYEDQTLQEVAQEIKDLLTSQQLQQEFFTWFEEFKQSAQLQNFLL